MRIRWYDRLILVIVSFILLGEAVVIVMLALGYGRESYDFWVTTLLNTPLNRAILGLVALGIALLALRLLLLRIRRTAGPDTVFMLSTDSGSIRITITAIEAIVQRAARQNAQVRDIRVRILPEENHIRVNLHVMITPDANAKDVSIALQNAVKAALEDNTGIPVPEVQTIIEAAPSVASQRVE